MLRSGIIWQARVRHPVGYANPGIIRTKNPSTLLWVQHHHQGAASIAGRVGRRMNVSVCPGLHHPVVLHPGLICHHRQGGSLIISFNDRLYIDRFIGASEMQCGIGNPA